MPEEAFIDLWQTLEAGKPWTGVVKNRGKNGDHYWVLANATPIREGGVVTGYCSIAARELSASCCAPRSDSSISRRFTSPISMLTTIWGCRGC